MVSGSIVALITPMKEDETLDEKSLSTLIRYHIRSGTQAIVVGGTTGEAATLNEGERLRLVEVSLEAAGGEIPIIAGTGSNATKDAIRRNAQLEGLGIAAALSVVPYYTRPPQRGIIEHFKALTQETAIPQILYNVPTRTACDLLPDTVAELAEFRSIIGLKEASQKVARVKLLRSLIDRPFLLWSGDDKFALEWMKAGGDGVISVAANVVADKLAELCQLASQQRWEAAAQKNRLLCPLYDALFVETNPIPVKWACWQQGKIVSPCLRLPLIPLAAEFHMTLLSVLKALDAIEEPSKARVEEPV